jgi:hypothetical protein
MPYFYDLIFHIAEALKKRPLFFSVVLILFAGLYSFFFALFTIPLPAGALGFYRMTPLSSFEYFYIAFSVIVSALIVTVMFHKAKLKMPRRQIELAGKDESKGRFSSFFGIAAGIFGAICPACLGINFLVLGNVFTAQLSFLIPYIFWVQLGGIALLVLGLYFVAKSSYEKKCLVCDTGIKGIKTVPQTGESSGNSQNAPELGKVFAWVLVGAAIVLLGFQISSAFVSSSLGAGKKGGALITASGEKIDINKAMQDAIEQVTPAAGFTTKVKWNGIVSKMVKQGVLDPARLENVLKKRYGQDMRPQWRAVLAGENAELRINSDNAVFMMYVLWALAKSNNNQILFDSPFAKYFKNYDIGIGKAGYGNVELLALTPKQQKTAKEVAEIASRPCCNNTTAQPDCSHGFSALGLVELMASQNFSKQEMFDVFVKFNSFWFPETYVKTALYFKFREGKNWSELDKELIAGKEYSSLSGAYKVKNYLKENFGL